MSKFNLPDPRNENTLVYVNGLVPRREAKVSVLDSVVQGGDAVWEGLRVYNSKIYQLEEHLDRLLDSAHVLQFENIPSRSEIRNAIFGTLKANNMNDGVHIRLTLSRGLKSTSGMNPQLNIYGCTLIVLPEYKGLVYGEDGLHLITSSVRRNAPYSLDSKIHHNNLINNILAKIEANHAGADDAVMLDQNGFIAETNATNIFLVRKGELLTPFADACLPGLTRQRVLEIAAELGLKAREKNLSMTEMYTADEMFTTGTMGALSWVKNVDGRQIGNAEKGPFCQQLQEYYLQKIDELAVPIP
ncbi:aminotransferase class IV [Croceimicrobium sp.]|uniref:aminotransferase class IV n=1 Tax=Croceimicrobium sp. TaxID=2828340 RepID=UPI003BA87CEA